MQNKRKNLLVTATAEQTRL